MRAVLARSPRRSVATVISSRSCPDFRPSFPSFTIWRSRSGEYRRLSRRVDGVSDPKSDVEPDQVGQPQRAHREAVTQLHTGVDIVRLGDLLFDHSDRLEGDRNAKS